MPDERNDHAERSDEQDGEDVLEIDIEDLEDEELRAPAAPVGDVLEITWDDLEEVDAESMEAPAAVANGKYAAVNAKALDDAKRADEIETYALCSSTGHPFMVYWVEVSPGFYEISRLVTKVPEQGDSATVQTVPSHGTFGLSKFTGCPHCGSDRLSVCGGCGVTICEGAVQRSFLSGPTLRCPSCGQRGAVEKEAGTVWGTAGGKGKGKGKGKMG